VNCLDTQGLFLRQALDVAPKDIAVNRHCANYKERLGEYDQAISCWQRLAGTKSVREEAEQEIARLSVEKTLRKQADRGVSSKEESGVTLLEQLQKKLANSPTDHETAFELADLLEREASIEEAEKVLVDALAASGNDLKVREHLEDRQIRWSKRRVMLAEKQVQITDSEATRETLDRLRTGLVKQEIDIFAARVERYPDNVSWKFELAIRLKTAGSPAEAIKYFQAVQVDSRRRGAVALELGECFQKIKQYPLAMRNYQTAVESLGDREIDLQKRALYRAGVLAAAMKDRDAALKFLSNLAEIDFGYRDVAQRLEKLNSEDA
jgi:tetratricopeptide (TPR) repeat protein